jgi:hypothetical protein
MITVRIVTARRPGKSSHLPRRYIGLNRRQYNFFASPIHGIESRVVNVLVITPTNLGTFDTMRELMHFFADTACVPGIIRPLYDGNNMRSANEHALVANLADEFRAIVAKA